MGNPAYIPQPTFAQLFAPQPPRLHWGWVLLFSVLTRSFFNDIWLLVQANWICKVTGRKDIRTWATVNLCKLPAAWSVTLAAGGLAAGMDSTTDTAHVLIGLLAITFGLAAFVIYLVTVYRVRAVLEDMPIGIPLGGVMTFFFGPVYFQYFLRDYIFQGYSAAPLPYDSYASVPPLA